MTKKEIIVSDSVRVIKKYPNRRLYDTEESKYITLTRVLEFIRQGIDFKVLDTQTGDDVTRSVLIQIIMEQENGETPLFTNDMLESFIRYCDDATRNVFTEFLEKNFQIFADQQSLFKDQTDKLVGVDAIKTMTDIAKQNMDMWQKMQESFLDNSGLSSNKDNKK